MSCATCGRNLGDAHRYQGLGKKSTLPCHCDAVCYAAERSLSHSALKIWRATCWQLNVTASRVGR